MVWGTVTGAGGTVDLASTLGEGTTFRLRLPSARARAEAPAAPPIPRAPGRQRRVLLLEDVLGVQKVMTRTLSRGGFTVEAHGDVDAAVRAVASSSFDLLLSDGIVPGGGVPRLIDTFRARFPRAPVIVCSGYVQDELTLHGTHGFLAKPFTPDQLLIAVDEAFRRASGSAESSEGAG